jgi:hypothetical protein
VSALESLYLRMWCIWAVAPSDLQNVDCCGASSCAIVTLRLKAVLAWVQDEEQAAGVLLLHSGALNFGCTPCDCWDSHVWAGGELCLHSLLFVYNAACGV